MGERKLDPEKLSEYMWGTYNTYYQINIHYKSTPEGFRKVSYY